MNRNVESHFSNVPHVEYERSTFDRSCSHKTSFNAGQLIPFFVDEVLPGDTFNITESKVARLQTLLTPILDNVYMDTYYFYVPLRQIWTHTKEFFGENTAGAWAPTVEYTIPKISAPEGGFATGSLADYFGLPVGVEWSAQDERAPSALPFRAYCHIVNEFFRDQNVSDPVNFPLGDENEEGSNGDNYITDMCKGGKPFIAAKFHDYFTSCLPSAQKASAPVTIAATGNVPVFSDTDNVPLRYRDDPKKGLKLSRFRTSQGGSDPQSWLGYEPATQNLVGAPIGSGDIPRTLPSNLWADVSQAGFTVNDLRAAFQLQKFYERQARSGSRYSEFLKSQFGVDAPNAALQRPEYLGGNRIQLAIHQVSNTAQSEQDFLGDVGAMSVTADVNEQVYKSFYEHGYVIGLAVVRYDHTYAQGIERFWSRSKMTDFYLPVFSSISEQPVYKSEIYALGNMDGKVFGFQEYAADYRYKPSRVSGEMRPGISNSLASWHLADYYSSSPSLSHGWMCEDKSIVDRVLAVSSSVSNQIFADFYVKNECTRVMPLYSVPGLIDHH